MRTSLLMTALAVSPWLGSPAYAQLTFTPLTGHPGQPVDPGSGPLTISGDDQI